MGVLTEKVTTAFRDFEKTGNIFNFARSMVNIGDTCRYQWHVNYVYNEINTIRESVPKYLPKSQASKYLKVKSKRRKNAN